MRLKFLTPDGYRVVEVSDYSFSRHPVPRVEFKHEGKSELVELNGDVYVTNERGDTIDKLSGKERS